MCIFAEDTLSVDVSMLELPAYSFNEPQNQLLQGEQLIKIATLKQNYANQEFTKLWWSLLFITSAFVLLYVVNNQYSNRLLKSLYSMHIAQKMARSPNNIGVLSGYLYTLLFCGLTAIAFNQFFLYFKDAWVNYYVIFLIVIAYLFIEIIFIEISGFILKKRFLAQKIRFNNTAIIFGSTIFLLPLAFLTVFSLPPFRIWSIYLAIVVLSTMFLYREARALSFIVSEKKSIGFFHFFLYICTFKITPFVLLVKVLMNIE